ncbi:H(2):CoB-CoM heterodisulfide,ferredoxin reductase subunit C [Candidatus Lokiarchaeum ossiferum]|uniref:H(2):CoB-CoM heterodisulfide,ferredoxin reductase subunit C n=1 Tax=Candidatus Lokiarchaeum ossiferum TaxID=2951803 RepID=A0ABY6HPB4_9ARCH|nr:H(2):CoB-CoM heterodisulfide,ferredoxin reductase subunit C [Candidatus Lokiarchaeum sp. B-35]
MVKADLNLKRAVLDLMMGGDKLSYCMQCGVCNDVCPISQQHGSRYNPRDLVLFSALGYKEALFAAVGRDPFALWGCTACETCDEMCPAEIPITEIICVLKNAACAAGATPEFYPQSCRTIRDNGMAIPVQPAINKRREKLGIGLPPAIPVDEVKAIMAATGIENTIKEKEEGSA